MTAASRSYAKPPPSSSVVSDYSNTRDNPLFGCSGSSSPESEGRVAASKGVDDVSGSRRGRSASRSSVGALSSGSRSETSRSLSRIGTGRRLRSVSRGDHGISEHEVDHGYGSPSSFRDKETCSFSPYGHQKKTNMAANDLELSEQTRNLQTWTSRHPISETWDTYSTCTQVRHWEDGISTSSFSEAEEATIRAFCKQMKIDHSSVDTGTGGIYETVRSEVQRAVSEIRNGLENAIRIKNPATITTENIVDIPPELVNTDAIELVSDIRRKCALKLEKSQDRARKLWADLAVEEQCGQELSRILNEIVPDPTSTEARRSRPRRKASMERLRMSTRLAEEAMNYFDECVSISTFDSSDFSSAEDPQPTLAIPSMGNGTLSCNEGSTFSMSHIPNSQSNEHEDSDNQTQSSRSIVGSNLTISSCSGIKAASLFHENCDHDDLVDFGTLQRGNSHYSLSDEPTETGGIHGFRHYIKQFEKDSTEGRKHVKVKSSYDTDDHDFVSSAESLLLERVILKNRIEYGGLLVCDVRVF